MKKILILDDDVALTMQWQSALQRGGHEVFVAHNADDALNLFRSEQIDLCVIDFIIRENGVATANGGLMFLGNLDVRDRKKTRILGVSGLKSGLPKFDPQKYLMTFGAENFLRKPFSDDELLLEVNEML